MDITQKTTDPSKLPDLKAELPQEYQHYVCDDDRVIGIEDHSAELVPPEKMIDPVKIMCQLGDVEKPEDLGNHFITASGILTGRESGKTQGKFVVPFPRDFCYMMMALKDVYPYLPERGILHINKYIALDESLYHEAEFGRDAHEVRDSATDTRAQEITARLGIQWPYYGQIDVGGLAIKLIHWICLHRPQGFSYLNQTYVGLDGKTYTVLDSLKFREQWLLRRLDSNPEGILEFKAAFPGSHPVQSMEDSPISHLRKNGELANMSKGVSSIEVLGDTYDSLIDLAEIYEHIDNEQDKNSSETKINDEENQPISELKARSIDLRKRAANIKQRIFDLWIPGRHYFGMGYDRGDNDELRILDANKAISAFILDTKIWSVNPRDPQSQQDNHKKIMEEYIMELFKPDMLTSAGLRTLSTNNKRFDPGRYHLGSVWPFMSYRVAEGLRRQGYPHLARELYTRIIKTFEHFKMWPELVRGDTDNQLRLSHLKIEVYNSTWQVKEKINVISQTVQGWSVSAHIGALHRIKEELPPITEFERNILDNLAS